MILRRISHDFMYDFDEGKKSGGESNQRECTICIKGIEPYLRSGICDSVIKSPLKTL